MRGNLVRGTLLATAVLAPGHGHRGLWLDG